MFERAIAADALSGPPDRNAKHRVPAPTSTVAHCGRKNAHALEARGNIAAPQGNLKDGDTSVH